METDFRAINAFQKQKKAVNRRILFPLDKNSDSTSQNEEEKENGKRYSFTTRESYSQEYQK